MGIPVRGAGRDRGGNVVPAGETAALERKTAQDLPPGLDQVEIGSIGGLEDELPARMPQQSEQDIGRAVGAEFVENGVDALHFRGSCRVHLGEERHPVPGGPPVIAARERLAGRRTEGPKDVAVPAPPIIGLLMGACSQMLGDVHQRPTRETSGALRPHLIQT